MKSAIKNYAVLAIALATFALATSCDSATPQRTSVSAKSDDTMRMAVLREAALAAGFSRSDALAVPVSPRRAAVGRKIFDSPLMSINGNISCRDCHLNEFGSSDGLPNAVGVGGTGTGPERMGSPGRILPRNTLPFWGRGSKGFDTFFWDGKVSIEDGEVISQYGSLAPSDDPLIVAVHLPSVELLEMVADTPEVRKKLVSESVSPADTIQGTLVQRFLADPEIGPALIRAYGQQRSKIEFIHLADALASFIRDEFRIRPTRLENFIFSGGEITEDELAGGILFYGRGRCAECHNGPYFSDMSFHAVAFPQAGFGKNGFGVDEGRYNVTLDPRDRFKFRTPPLFNVDRTGPYSHSGSLTSLEDSIFAHFDPLRLYDTRSMDVRERSDLYARLGPAALEPLPAPLQDDEVKQLVAFLRMLSFDLESSEDQ